MCPSGDTQASKKTAICSHCGQRCKTRYDKSIKRVRDLTVGGYRMYLEFEQWRVNCPRCQGVHIEKLDWLAKNPRYTQRFAMHVGKLCREMTNKAVADLEHLHHSTVKDLDKIYMHKQIAQADTPAPQVIGIDEIAIRKGHNYRVIVSDLERNRPIWVGGEGRKEADLDAFFAELGPKKAARIRLAVMDMWKPFRNSVHHNVPSALIVFDKFHIMRHLADALDEVRRREYRRLKGKDRSYIKGHRYTLLSNWENLSLDGRKALRKLLTANKRLNTAYLLKESFGQLWDYKTERGARDFFERWKESLKWQRLEPYQKFAAMIEKHWQGIASYCHPDNKVSLGLVEGLNNKIRVLQRRAYGYRDEEYLKLKIIAAFLPPLTKSAENDPH
jgi:transposase